MYDIAEFPTVAKRDRNANVERDTLPFYVPVEMDYHFLTSFLRQDSLQLQLLFNTHLENHRSRAAEL